MQRAHHIFLRQVWNEDDLHHEILAESTRVGIPRHHANRPNVGVARDTLFKDRMQVGVRVIGAPLQALRDGANRRSANHEFAVALRVNHNPRDVFGYRGEGSSARVDGHGSRIHPPLRHGGDRRESRHDLLPLWSGHRHEREFLGLVNHKTVG